MMDETDREAHQKLPPVICYPVDTLPAPCLLYTSDAADE